MRDRVGGVADVTGALDETGGDGNVVPPRDGAQLPDLGPVRGDRDVGGAVRLARVTVDAIFREQNKLPAVARRLAAQTIDELQVCIGVSDEPGKLRDGQSNRAAHGVRLSS